jgi:3',5'-cyclic AMP phosphodiesterase CpdA
MKNRRSFIKNASIITLSGALVTTKFDVLAKENAKKNIKRVIRAAHLTDIHLLATAIPKEAFKRVLQAINTMADPPQLIINSGDSVMDMNNQSKTHIQSLWDSWNEIIATNYIPMRGCIGNHDVWYAPEPASETDKADPLYGKGMILKQLNLPSPYYSFTQNGWKFIALDSINPGPDNIGYVLGDQQFNWLENELAHTDPNMPVLIFSHIPIITVTAILYYVQRGPVNKIKYPGYDQHADAKRIKDLFYKYKNVKVALSGHIHYLDSVDYLGVKYHCGGAVSGNWWNGTLDEFAPAYSILDLYEDGSSQYETIFYKWD